MNRMLSSALRQKIPRWVGLILGILSHLFNLKLSWQTSHFCPSLVKYSLFLSNCYFSFYLLWYLLEYLVTSFYEYLVTLFATKLLKKEFCFFGTLNFNYLLFRSLLHSKLFRSANFRGAKIFHTKLFSQLRVIFFSLFSSVFWIPLKVRQTQKRKKYAIKMSNVSVIQCKTSLLAEESFGVNFTLLLDWPDCCNSHLSEIFWEYDTRGAKKHKASSEACTF